MQRGSLVQTYAAHQAAVNTLSWSPDGRYLASTSEDRTIRIWRALSGETVSIYRGHTDSVSSVSWSPSSASVSITSGSSDGSVQIWSVVLS